jgi:hypothetical protein
MLMLIRLLRFHGETARFAVEKSSALPLIEPPASSAFDAVQNLRDEEINPRAGEER